MFLFAFINETPNDLRWYAKKITFFLLIFINIVVSLRNSGIRYVFTTKISSAYFREIIFL